MANQINDTSIELENDSNAIANLKYQITQLTKENDDYQQTIYSLQSKVQVDLGIRNELQETIDNLEKSLLQMKRQMEKKINNIEEKNGIAKMEMMSRLNEMEYESGVKLQENRELRQKLMETEKLLKLVTAEKQTKDLNVKDETSSSESQIIELMEKLLQEENARKCLECTVNSMSKEECELKTILEMNKKHLAEKSEMLKMVQDELQECRIELETLKNIPASEMCKGNSLFAEVEDRRKKLLDQMANMKTTYYDAKRCLSMKNNEIKALKIELSALLNKQKDDADKCVQENGDLLDMYKDRVLELENKLSEQQKKYRKLETQKQPTDNSFSYFQSLLETKRKEIEELEAKLEHSSMQLLIQEEMKLKANRQMRYWRNKAMSYEAQVETIKFQLQNNSSFDIEKISKIFQRDRAMKTSSSEVSFINSTEKLPPVIDETVLSLDELINIPKLSQYVYHQDEERAGEYSHIPPTDNASPGSSNSNDELNVTRKWHDNETVENKQSNQTKCDIKAVNRTSPLIGSMKSETSENQGKEKKYLRFTEGTVDPEPRKLHRLNTPKYPILYVTNKPSNE